MVWAFCRFRDCSACSTRSGREREECACITCTEIWCTNPRGLRPDARLCAPVPPACACGCVRARALSRVPAPVPGPSSRLRGCVRACLRVRLRLCCLTVRVLGCVLGAMGAALAATWVPCVALSRCVLPCVPGRLWGCPGEVRACAGPVSFRLRGRALSLLASSLVLCFFSPALQCSVSFGALSLFVLCPPWILLDHSGDSGPILWPVAGRPLGTL